MYGICLRYVYNRRHASIGRVCAAVPSHRMYMVALYEVFFVFRLPKHIQVFTVTVYVSV